MKKITITLDVDGAMGKVKPEPSAPTEEKVSESPEQFIKVFNEDIIALWKELDLDLGALFELRNTHQNLWDKEDEARSKLATDEQIAVVKRRIDVLNGNRHKLIEKFDRHFYKTPPAEANVYYSETPGELSDRLIILNLKIRNSKLLQNSADLGEEHRCECIKKVEKLTRWSEHLKLILQNMLIDFKYGRAMLPPRSEFKMYNQTELNPVTRGEQSRVVVDKPANGKLKNVKNVLSIACTGHGASLSYLSANGEVRSSVFDRWIGTKHTLIFSKDELHDITTKKSELDALINRVLTTAFGGFPNHQVFEEVLPDWFNWLVKDLDVTADDIDLLVISESHFATSFFRLGPRLTEWFPNAYLDASVEHHAIHQRQAFWQSGFDEAAVLTLDTCGEELDRLNRKQICGTISRMNRKGDCEVIKEFLFPEASIGLIYAITNHHIGFRQGQEGKTMGLAPYGRTTLYDKLRKHLELYDDGSFTFLSMEDYQKELTAYVPERPNSREVPLTQLQEDVAYAGQAILQDVLINAMDAAMRLTGLKKVVYAGGVALNSVANELAVRAVKPEDIFIAPNPSDTGQSLGAALFGAYELADWQVKGQEMSDYLGPSYTKEEIDKAVAESDGEVYVGDDVLEKIAQCIANGYIVGRFGARAEFGPRSLGNRSIMADPRREDMKDYLNSRVKHREGFRPFAPSVQEEHVSEWFDLNERSAYMLRVCPVLEEVRDKIPAIVHVDGSARVQTVSKKDNPAYWEAIDHFKALTGVPLVVNTSFNVAGKPVVETPAQAIDCFENTDIDLICFDHCILSKKPLTQLLNNPR